MCGRLWSSAVRRRFGERCPECEADAARPAGGAGREGIRDANERLVGPRGPGSSSSPDYPARVARPADRHAGPPNGGALVR
jgi:hypothetical protein